MMFMDNRGSTLDELLGLSIAAFDIPEAVYRRAVARYTDLADWMAENDGGYASGVIYTQGSIRLGTMVTPIDPQRDYDIDLVYRRDLQKGSITQAELKAEAGLLLDRYLATGPEGAPRKSAGKRCWTLDYPAEPFHMDTLPTIPNPEAPPDGVLLTDRDLPKWQPSNPVAYADWFHAVMAEERLRLREAMAKQIDVEDAPPDGPKTTLQRSTQALKRHRDLFFAGTDDAGPASIIISTLAAKAYSGGGTLYEVLTDVTAKMPTLIRKRGDVYWIENPVQKDENFADRWKGKSECPESFFRWISAAQEHFRSYGADLGIDQVMQKMARSFGDRPVQEAKAQFGSRLTRERERGGLGVRSTGRLAVAAPAVRPIPQHTFHGDARTRRRP
jgi:hypothetical protein